MLRYCDSFGSSNEFTLFSDNYHQKPNEVNRDGYLMLEDLVIANYFSGELKLIEPSLCPFYILRTKDFEGWVRSRAIDIHRTNSRILRKSIRLMTTDEFSIVMNSYCVTITDRYWFKPSNSTLCYDDVKFTSDRLAPIALDGKFFDACDTNIKSPEFTNTGSFEKCWKLINGNWFIIKKATELERFSELLVYRLGKHLSLDMAKYFINPSRTDIIISQDFTVGGKLILESMWSLINDNEDYKDNINLLKSLNESIVSCTKDNLIKQYLDILFMDTLCMNVDRHTNNYGFLRDRKTGKIISLAPNFDNNLALISRGVNRNITHTPNRLINEFKDVLMVTYYKIPSLIKEDLISIVEKCAIDCDLRNPNINYVVTFIWNNYCLLR